MFNFENLNSQTRSFMLEAIEEAEKTSNIYYSTRLNEAGKKQWVPLLKQAASEKNEHWLAFRLEENQLLKSFEGAQKPSGGYSTKYVPNNASLTLAEGQFNRFYILGLCKLARSKGISELIVYRAKTTQSKRSESESIINSKISIDNIETQLKDVNASFQSKLVQPNSGISMKLP